MGLRAWWTRRRERAAERERELWADERRVFPNIAHTRRIAREEIEHWHAERLAARTPEQEP
jgi:hypothetical protein